MQISKKKLRNNSAAPTRQSLWRLLALVALLLGPAAPAAWAQCEKLVWQDEFNDPAIDRSKWELEVNGTGQGTGQLDYATDRPQNASIVNGNLVLNILKEEYGGLHYTSARLRTYKKVDFQYGRIEARLKGVYSQGNGFAFWMLGSDYETVAWPKCGEVDIFENTGRLPEHNIGTAHYQEGYGHAYNQGAYDLPTGQRWADAYHVVGIEWSPTYIKWYIDGQVYHTMDLTNPINGYRPFNRPFFLLLSVGMGGDYSGPPDATTVNPMSATIDWVHVYKGTYSTFVSGDNQVYKGEQNKQYSLTTTDDATNTYAWTVPGGARILSGQGTKTINVDWGQAGGNVSVQVTSSCNSPAATYSLSVTAEEPFVADKVFENFEVPPALTYTTMSGSFTKGVPNPLVNSVNPSPKVGKYIRNAGAQYDVLGMQNVNATPAGDFVLGKRRILLDVYSDAPPGTKVSLNFENSRVANAGNYPSGRYANFEAVTSKQGQWETLEFAFTGTPDQYAGASDVDQWILLFAPVTYTGNVFYFDNLRTGQPGGPPRTLDTKVLQNFDGVTLLTKDFSNGTYAVQANPSKVAPNTSNTVAKYVRDAGTSYDALVYLTTAISDARPFRLGNSKVSMDVYTDAPVGTKLSLNFEISTISLPNNFPSGRYASFEAVTTRQNQWETVTFSLSSIPDAGASDAAVDKLVFLLNPVTNTGNTYYIDNIQVNSTAPKENLVLAGIWEDYDANRNLTLNYATGTYTPLAANPAPAGINTSAHVAQYVRNPAEQYDRIIFNKNTAAIDPTALKNRTQKIAIDVYTSAPAGTPISVGLDATSLETASNYPTGRHSNYQGVTTVQNAWHTVYFTLGGQPDASTPDNLVDSFAVLFESGRTTNTTYYFDNIRVLNVVPQPTLTTLVVTPALTQNLAVGATQQYTAQGKDQFGNNVAAPGVTWAVSGGGSISASGLFTASANGAFKVTASSSGLLGKADVLVGQGLRLTTLSVDPISTFVYQGSTLALTARGVDQTGAPATFTPTWAVSGATGISISPTGVLTATSTASGTVAVVVSSGTTSATATITVRTPPVADSISVSPTKVKVYQGDALQFAASALDQYRNPITATYTWSVSGGGAIDAAGLFTSTTIGTFVVKAQAGAAVTSTYVSVVPKPANLALNRPTRASSTQGTLTAFYATDGTTGRTTPDTRWASASTDTEWIRVDLGQTYDLSRVVLYWEAAYGKIYDIQVANDTLQTRRLAYHEPNGDGNVDDLTLAAGTYGRYVWMSGTLRGTPYGYSLFEMEVYGMLHQNPVLKSIIVTPNFSTVATSTSVAFAAAGFDQFGNNAAITPTWTTTGGTINGTTGAFSAAAAGSYTITATAGGVSGTASITVTGGMPQVSPNLALNKPARASSVGNAGNPARNAVDGNATSTRWESVSADPQWLRVDLGATYTLNRVKLTWETALGKDYVVQISADTVNWTPLKTVTGNTALVNDWTGLAGTGRYLRIYGTARGTGWGYSIYELEAYGAGNGSGNQAPTIAITAPAKNAVFTGLAPVTITADAADTDGSVAKVEFYAGTTLVSTDTSAPYSATWTPAATGTYALTAKAYDNLNVTTTSATVSVTVNAAGGGLIIPGRVEAESFTTMSGIATEATSDTGGGQNIGYIDSGDWLDYAVTVQTAGTYTVQFRVAGFAANAQLQLKAGSTVLATVAVPNTGGGQVWTTISASAALPAGSQTLRVAITGGGFNFNWMDFARTGARGTATATAEPTKQAGPLGMYPNPVANTATLTGIASFPATVGVYDARGARVKQVLLQEPGEAATIDVSGLSKGLYLIRTTSPGAVQTQRFIKE